MKKILFLLLPFIWQCNLDSMFEPADLGSLGNSVISSEVTTKPYSIHSVFNPGDLPTANVVDGAYSSPSMTYLTDENYVFYGKVYNNRDAAATSSHNVYMLLEIRNVGGKIKVNSAYTTRLSRSKPLDLYNARTELPTVVREDGGVIKIGLWPKFSKLTHENLATTNISRFDYVSMLQSKLYTNIVQEGSYSLLKADSGIGSPINSSASIASLKTIVSGSVWNSVNYPSSLNPISSATNYYFFPNSTLAIGVGTTASSTATTNYGWDIWTYNGLDKVEGPFTEHYLYIYREFTLASLRNYIVPPGGGQPIDYLRLVFSSAMPPASNISNNDVFGNLIRLSIAP